MVKTRNNWDADDEDEVEFRRSKRKRLSRTQTSLANGYDSDESIEYKLRRTRKMRPSLNVKVDDSEAGGNSSDDTQPDFSHAKKQNPASSHVQDSGSNNSDEEAEKCQRPRRAKRTRRRGIEVNEDSDDIEESKKSSPKHQIRASTRRRRSLHVEDDSLEEPDSEQPIRRRLRRHTQPPSHLLASFQMMDNIGQRRSGRQRKLLYSTFNQNTINKHLGYSSDMFRDPGERPSRAVRGTSSAVKYRKPTRSHYGRSEVKQQHDETNDDDDDDEEEDDDDGEENENDEDENARQRQEEELMNMDMYTRVKRERRQVKRDMYGIPIPDSKKSNGETATESSSEEDQPRRRSYDLRTEKPRTKLYQTPIAEPRSRSNKFSSLFHKESFTHDSPARKSSKRYTRHRRRGAILGSSSTSSSSSSSGSDSDMSKDAARFERRKNKSMAKARNRCLPMNMSAKEMLSGIFKDRQKIGSSLADVSPMTVDKSVTFDSVGGLGKHIRALKEMIVFPLMYPEVFDRFKITPPRGVLFAGPPGTGKTLVAKALANECSNDTHKVAFFMRKGADCLSKWVGESERQLRLLFDQAYKMRPSIIFFDEIDGLAPVRSSRQDQIHSSIVSTLLALMDGLDSRGEIVVIGATNRIDSIDPALRRPGRFDREFTFPLPSVEARAQILSIHTKPWVPKLNNAFLCELAEKTVGYCGADLRALCTEAALHAFRRRYPQVYNSKHKLKLDVEDINLSAADFKQAMSQLIPASQRSVNVPSRRLAVTVQPLLQSQFERTIQVVDHLFAIATTKRPSSRDIIGNLGSDTGGCDMLYSDEEDDGADQASIFDTTGRHGRPSRYHCTDSQQATSVLNMYSSVSRTPPVFRPRLLLSGVKGQGQNTHLGPAVLHHLEGVPVHLLDLPTLYANSARTPEEACAQVFREACRNSPSVIYIPHIYRWWQVSPSSVQETFITLLEDLTPDAPIMLIATSQMPYKLLPEVLRDLFHKTSNQVITMRNPNSVERQRYFEPLILEESKKAPPTKKLAARRALEMLPRASSPPPRTLSEGELKKMRKLEEATMRELRLFLRDVVNKLCRDKKFSVFTKPVDAEEVEDYYEVIKEPMDLSTMMSKIDLHQYQTVKQMMCDIDLIVSNALEYNPDNDIQGRAIRHRACALRDTAQAIIEAELDPDFEKACEEVLQAIQDRGESPMKHVPNFYYTKPPEKPKMASLDSKPVSSTSSRTDDTKKTEAAAPSTSTSPYPGLRRVVRYVYKKRSSGYNKNISPWCRPTSRKYRRVKQVTYIDNLGNEVDVSELERDVKVEQRVDEMEMDVDEKSPEKALPHAKSPSRTPQLSPSMPVIRNTSDHHSPHRSSTSPGAHGSAHTSPRAATSTHTSPRAVVNSTHTSPRAAAHTPYNHRHTRGSVEMTVDTGTPTVSSTAPRESRRLSSRRSSANTTLSPPTLTPAYPTTTTSPVTNGVASSSEQAHANRLSPAARHRHTRSGESVDEVGMLQYSPRAARDDASQPASSSTAAGVATCLTTLPRVSMSPTRNAHDTTDSVTDTATQSEVAATHQSALSRSAQQALSAPIGVVTGLDNQRLHTLLDTIVSSTDNWTVESLQSLHAQLAAVVFQHRAQHNKALLIEDLEKVVSTYSKLH